MARLHSLLCCSVLATLVGSPLVSHAAESSPKVRDHRGQTPAPSAGRSNPALEAALARAVSAAMNGPEVKKLKVAGHEFNVKKATVTGGPSAMTIKGQISHHLTARPDDQVHYTVKKSNGRVTSVDVKIDRGGIAKYVGYVSRLAKDYVNSAIPASDIESWLRNLGRKVDGSWESSADLIVAAVAMKIGPASPAPVAGQRPAASTASRPEPAVRRPGSPSPARR